MAVWSSMGWPASAQQVALTAQANVMVEARFRSSRAYSDPFTQVTLDIIFVEPQGRESRVPAFWAGSNVWKVRYASPVLGRHAFRTECSDTTNPGLHGQTGAVTFEPYTGTNQLFIHGPLRVAKGKTLQRASLWASADDRYAARLNGHALGECADWRSGRQFQGLDRWQCLRIFRSCIPASI